MHIVFGERIHGNYFTTNGVCDRLRISLTELFLGKYRTKVVLFSKIDDFRQGFGIGRFAFNFNGYLF